MPFYANTPESLLGRSDSKNPATTCRGITSGGRPCRRPIAASSGAASAASPLLLLKTRTAKPRVDDPSDPDLYCWQHKEQASLSARSSPGPRVSNTPILEERTSLDTLADRLGIIGRQSEIERPQKQNGRPSGSYGGKPSHPSKMTSPKPKKTTFSFCFCFSVPVEEASPPPRPKPRPLQTASATSTPTKKPATSGVPSGRRTSNQHLAPSTASPARAHRPSVSSGQSGRSSHVSILSSSSQAAQYLSLIPPTASPQTASLLMAELAKPFSAQDDPGYIYIFWLTPESQPATPPVETARSLLLASPGNPTRPGPGSRRVSDVLASFAAVSDDGGTGTRTRGLGSGKGSSAPDNKKILLKIGRATNVQRRLNEWQRQCGYNLSLIRYYPYIPSTSPGAVQPRKMPHSHKVERLIHIELAGLGLRVADREKCDTCGREHREWFEVEATRKGVAGVDEIVKRWVEWDEGMA